MVRERYTPDRAAGVEFGELEAALSAQEFPCSGRELIDACGDREVEHQRGVTRFGDLFEPLAEQQFDSPGAVHQAVLSVIGEEAVGRKGYSDRDPTRRDEPDAEDRSF